MSIVQGLLSGVVSNVLTGVIRSDGFDPRSIPDLALWLDASQIKEPSGELPQIDDYSGEGNHATQATGTRQAVTGTRTVNGKNVLDFDGTDDFYSLPSGFYTGLGEGNSTTFFVYTTDTPAASQRLINGFNVGGGTRWMLAYNQAGADTLVGQSASSFTPVTHAITNDSNVHIDVFVRDGTTVKVYRDSITNVTSAENGTDVTLFSASLGASSTPGEFFNGRFCEERTWKRVLTDAQIIQNLNDLKSKWLL